MQQCLHDHAGGRLGPSVHRGVPCHAPIRHRALMLIGPRSSARLTPAVTGRVLDRLLVPSAQVEGVDMHLGDPELAQRAEEARGFVLVLPPLGNLSNPFYSVHPRRNDRFVAARPALKALFPDVDFAAIAFTGHALGTLAGTCPDRFAEVRKVLAALWVTRMRLLLERLPVKGVLIDLPSPGWLPRPPIPGEGRRRLAVNPEDRIAAAEALRFRLGGRRP